MKEGFYTWYFFSLNRTLIHSNKGSQAREMVFFVLKESNILLGNPAQAKDLIIC